jgi:hypothetical protein
VKRVIQANDGEQFVDDRGYQQRQDGPTRVCADGWEVYFVSNDCSVVIRQNGEVLTFEMR